MKALIAAGDASERQDAQESCGQKAGPEVLDVCCISSLRVLQTEFDLL